MGQGCRSWCDCAILPTWSSVVAAGSRGRISTCCAWLHASLGLSWEVPFHNVSTFQAWPVGLSTYPNILALTSVSPVVTTVAKMFLSLSPVAIVTRNST
ncbi:hypothetical protein WN943_011709 [Citrus x changshan-huyou]